jgi:rhomboid family GlyGly-CTERM serine protease
MRVSYSIETAVFTALLIIFNLPGLVSPSAAALFPSAIHNGELWRWLTFPWAHISLYHLVLDGAAFLCLYHSLHSPCPVRLFHLAASILFSGLVPLLVDPRLETIGLRGLSGVAHGLAVVTAVETLSTGGKAQRLIAVAVLVGISTKCAIEQSIGQVLFAEYHLGNVGLPVPACHLGGAIGGVLSSFVVSLRPRAAMIKRLAPVTAMVLLTLGCHSWREEATLAGVPFEKARVERDEIIGVIKEDRLIAGRPCRRGWVHLYTNGIPSGFTASRAIDLPRFTIPPNTWVLQDRTGAVRICAFPQDITIQGHLCRGGTGGPNLKTTVRFCFSKVPC